MYFYHEKHIVYQSPFGNIRDQLLRFKRTEYPEVAREEMARYGGQDALGNGQQEQES